VDVWLQGDRVAALADDADLRPFRDGAPTDDARRPELEQRHGVAVVGRDRDRAPAAGHEADEGDGTAGGRQHGATDLGPDVDASMLAARVRVGTDGERPQHRPIGRPRPGERARRRDEGRKDDRGQHRGRTRSAHLTPAFVCVEGNSRPR
jgi:hypothetical protein